MPMLLLQVFLMITPPVFAKTLLIHPVGDSITHGAGHNGYRLGLARALKDQKVDFHFVGTLEHGSPDLPERAHDGHDGWRTDQINANIEAWLQQFKPDVILLMIGANDIESGVTVDGLVAKYQKLLDQIAAKAPTTWVLVSEISIIRVPKFDALAQSFNQRLADLVRTRVASHERLVFVPMHDALGTGDLRDLDHPTTRGNEKMAARWMEHLGPLVTKL